MVWTNAAYPFANPWAGRQFNPWTGQLEVASPTASPVVQADSPVAVSSSGMLGGADASPARSADSTPSAQPNERARQGIVDAFTDNAKLGAVKGIGMLGTSMAMGAPVTAGDFVQGVASGVMNPSNAASIAGDVISASAGLSKPQSVWGKALSRIPGLAMGMLNPLAGVAYGVFGPVATDAVMDFAGWRENDIARDKLEDSLGQIPGRQAYASAMQDVEDRSLGDLDSFAKAAEVAGKRVGMAHMSPDVQAANDKMLAAYSQLAQQQSIGPTARSSAPKGWSNTHFGRLTQNQGWAARQDKRDAQARAAAARADAVSKAMSGWGSGGGGGGSGTGHNDGHSDRGRDDGGRGIY